MCFVIGYIWKKLQRKIFIYLSFITVCLLEVSVIIEEIDCVRLFSRIHEC